MKNETKTTIWGEDGRTYKPGTELPEEVAFATYPYLFPVGYVPQRKPITQNFFYQTLLEEEHKQIGGVINGNRMIELYQLDQPKEEPSIEHQEMPASEQQSNPRHPQGIEVVNLNEPVMIPDEQMAMEELREQVKAIQKKGKRR